MAQLDTLTKINLDDLVSSFGFEKRPILAALARRLFVKPAYQFAQHIVEFDECVSEDGLYEASRRFLRQHYVRNVCVQGFENIPVEGPALFLSNHPGMADTISLFAAIHRADLKTIALHRPFLAALTNVTRQLFFIKDDPAEGRGTIRQVSNHLREGGAALTFPAGEIEPDPEVYSGALDSLHKWTDSARVFIHFAPQTKIIPVLVSGVIWEKTAHHPLTRLKRTRFDRERLAAALQLLAMVTRNERPTVVNVRFARPITLDEEIGSTDSRRLHQVVLNRMRELIESQPPDTGISALEF
jgi:1-acyl-sn-glycerol-3-phosphate acyltransferase